MKEFIKYVGMDVHKETIAVSVAPSNAAEVRFVGEIANTPQAIERLVKQLRNDSADLKFCYEAGPCGYGIHRQLMDLGWQCQVVAPSLIPKRAGELTAVWVPDGAQEALRDLTRAREDMKHLQRQAKQRLLAFLLRHGRSYSGKSNWTLAHYRWLEETKFEQAVQQIVFQEYVDTVKAMTKRVEALDKQIESAAPQCVFWAVIQALMALRGVNLLTAVAIVAEIGDLKRFASAPQLMAYLGVVPSEHSSGGTKSRGGITKTGNGHVRRVLVEAAWTYRHRARKTATLQRRCRAHLTGDSGDYLECTKAHVWALQAARRPRQTQGASLHGRRA
jgi:transposase